MLDFFAGSGTIGESAFRNGRSAVLVDNNEEAMQVMAERLAFACPEFHGWKPEGAGPAGSPGGSAATRPALRDPVRVHENQLDVG